MPDTTILAAVRKSLRLTAHIFDDDISELIEAAKTDLITGGVNLNDENEPLVRQAIKFYCRANFQNGDSKERELYGDRYDRLKAQLSACTTLYGVPVNDNSSGDDQTGGDTP